jgi:hypothetical protein
MDLLHLVEAYTKGLTAVKGAVDLLEEMKDLLPKGEAKSTLIQKISEAEHALQLVKMELGQSLDRVLCQCTWPPQVMIPVGSSEPEGGELLKCPNCGKQFSRPHKEELKKGGRKFDPYDVY